MFYTLSRAIKEEKKNEERVGKLLKKERERSKFGQPCKRAETEAKKEERQQKYREREIKKREERKEGFKVVTQIVVLIFF